MKLKGIELKGTHKVKFGRSWFEVYDENGKVIYVENGSGDWYKNEYDEKGNKVYYEHSNGYWQKSEYDENGIEIYFEDSQGWIKDNRIKELTIEEIEKLLGYKIKVKEVER